MNFFLDRCVPVAIGRALACVVANQRHSVILHDDKFAPATSDVEWLSEIGKWSPKPVVISGDVRILRRQDEQRTLIEQDLTFVCLAPGWTAASPDDVTWKFFKAWPEIRDKSISCKLPSIFEVSFGGNLKVELKHLTRELKVRGK